jgi:predicted nucleotidyltransferase
MSGQPDIEDLARRIAAEFRPRRIVLFGSRAYGRPRPDSDVDLLVVLPFTGSALKLAAEIVDRVNPAYPLDLVVRSPDDVERRYRFGDPLIREALDRGRVLYEAAA